MPKESAYAKLATSAIVEPASSIVMEGNYALLSCFIMLLAAVAQSDELREVPGDNDWWYW